MKTIILVIFMSFYAEASTIEVLNCLHEARGESFEGKVAVHRTVLSRVKKNRFPSTTEEVIMQPKQFSWTHQKDLDDNFTFAEVDECVKAIAKAEKLGAWEYDHYFANDGLNKIDPPKWASNAKATKQINNHMFLALD